MDGSSNSATNSRKRVRAVNFTTKECETIVNLAMKYKHIIENRRCDSSTWKAKEAAWNRIRKEFNKIIGNDTRTASSIRAKYETLKKYAKKERNSLGDVRYPFLTSSIKENIRILQESCFDVVVDEKSVDLVKGDSIHVPVVDIKKEIEDGHWSGMEAEDNRMSKDENGCSDTESEGEKEEVEVESVMQGKQLEERNRKRPVDLDDERRMKRKEHQLKVELLRLKTENQLKESQEHDLKIQSLKLDLEIKKRQLKLLQFKDFSAEDL